MKATQPPIVSVDTSTRWSRILSGTRRLCCRKTAISGQRNGAENAA